MSEQKKDIGSLWKKSSEKAPEYMTGVIELDGKKYQLVIFPNDKGDNERRPDYKIRLSEPRQDASASIPF